MSYNAPMRDFFDAQFPNLFLWAPLILALGAAAYFAGPTEPQVAYPGLIAALAGLILVVRRPRAWLAGPMLLIFGFCYAMAFTHMMGTPTIPRDLRDVTITGTITRVDHTPDKTRVHIRIPADQINPKLSPATSARVRINIDGDAHVGDHIQATAALFRPSAANAPETFDYARWAYFNGLAATGYATRYTITPGTGNGGIHRLRDRMHDAAGSFLTDALVLGDGAALPRDARAIWTAAGVGHVWSISGFHMTLVGGWLFALFYGIFRLIPGITRRIPARIPALMAAWGGLTFYLFLSGAGVATLRAYLMTTLGFMAVALGRRAINLRNVCLAFALIILINPYYVMQPGFQLSFAAIFGLVWYFGDAAPYQRRTRIERVRRAIGATVLTSVIATLFTAPFVAAHFYAMPTYGLVGNLILLPIFSFLLMPLVLTGTLTATLWGWTGPITWAGGIYEWGLAIAGRIASLPGAVILMPHIPNVAMVLMILGLAGIIFIRPAPDAKQAH
ncbi:ComEC family competence protein [bacterium]|nr:ComEC family competence protein [bacterium]